MYILGIRIHASNDVLYKMWAVAAALILAVAAVLTWSSRFRETAETSVSLISPFGAEVAGKEAENFTGKRGFFAKMNKMGLPPAMRKAELATLFAELDAAGVDARNVPVLWLYAEGKTKEDRDRCVQTYGKVFFEKSRFCFSVADGKGFAVQLDPDTFRVLWAKDGGAVCALPLLSLPSDSENGFVLRIEERIDGDAWRNCGEIRFGPIFPEIVLPSPEKGKTAAADVAEDGNVLPEPDPQEIEPEEVVVESFTLPRECRFSSAPLNDRAAFGELRLRIRGNASGKVPASAWTLDNFSLESALETVVEGDFENGEIRVPAQRFPMTRPDAFRRNVRFLEQEVFESGGAGELRVPVAKTLFPEFDEDGRALPFVFRMRFVRDAYFPEDFRAFPPLRVGKNDSVLPETISAGGSRVKVRAFRQSEYYRLLNNKIPAIVLEIDQDAAPDAEFFWAPYRVKTLAGEELFPESVVNVRPGVRQYWFVPRRGVPEKIEVVYAVTRCVYREGFATPEVRQPVSPAEKTTDD